MRELKARVEAWRTSGLAGWQRIAVVVGLAVVLLGAGSVAATARAGATSGRILAGVHVGGVDVGGMTRSEAIAAVQAATRPKLRRGVWVVGGGKRWPVTPAGLGRGAAVEEAVDQLDGGVGRRHRQLGREGAHEPLDPLLVVGVADADGVGDRPSGETVPESRHP